MTQLYFILFFSGCIITAIVITVRQQTAKEEQRKTEISRYVNRLIFTQNKRLKRLLD